MSSCRSVGLAGSYLRDFVLHTPVLETWTDGKALVNPESVRNIVTEHDKLKFIGLRRDKLGSL